MVFAVVKGWSFESFDSGDFTAMQAGQVSLCVEIKGWLSDVFELIWKCQLFGIEEVFVVNNRENGNTICLKNKIVDVMHALRPRLCKMNRDKHILHQVYYTIEHVSSVVAALTGRQSPNCEMIGY